jgi:hypothetical protein
MLTAISKQPSLTNLKNDFAIQGTRKSATGADILIHMRYAISDKPVKYHSIKEDKTYVSYEYIDYVKDTTVNSSTFNQKIYYIRNAQGKFEKAKEYIEN